MKLLKYFERYMNEHLIKAGADILAKDADQLSRTPYLHQWYRSTSSVIMQLTNGTLQVCYVYNYIVTTIKFVPYIVNILFYNFLQINFTDHKKIILCPLMNAVTYIENNVFRTYRFNTIAEYGCSPELTKCLDIAYKKIGSILQDSPV